MRKIVKLEWPIKNKDLYAQIVISKREDKLTQEAEQMLILLAEKASRRLSYANEEDRKDCIAFAHMDLLKYWRGFNPDKGNNPFAYYSSLAKNGCCKNFNKAYKYGKKFKGHLIRMNGGGRSGSDNEGVYTI